MEKKFRRWLVDCHSRLDKHVRFERIGPPELQVLSPAVLLCGCICHDHLGMQSVKLASAKCPYEECRVRHSAGLLPCAPLNSTGYQSWLIPLTHCCKATAERTCRRRQDPAVLHAP